MCAGIGGRRDPFSSAGEARRVGSGVAKEREVQADYRLQPRLTVSAQPASPSRLGVPITFTGSFRCKENERLFGRLPSRRLPSDVQRAALRTLRLLAAVESLDELRSPPGNRLEALKGDREGLGSIRINDQWRLCFRWDDGAAHDVEIVDYPRFLEEPGSL